jgi:taurine dioxygenase
MNNLSITPGTNNVGAYISNIDLKNLNQNQTKEIKKNLNQFGVIFIKEQNLDPDSYQKFAKNIGQPVIYPRLKGLDEKFPFINVIERKPEDKNLSFGSSWLHQDTSYLSNNRPRYTMLMGIEIPKGQGNTIFSSGFNAYEKLPSEIKEKIQDAKGTFSSAGPISVTRLEREKEMGIKSSKIIEAEHPIVKTVNGKKTLYVSPGHLIKISNVKEGNSNYLKDYLIKHVNKKEFIFSYEWSKGDICLWDNLSILHMASEIKNCKRVMHRITIK